VPPKTRKATTPVEELSPAERERTLRTVRNLRRTLDITAQRLCERSEAAVERGVVPGLDPDVALAIHRLTQAISVLLETHPGLERLIDGDAGVDGAGAIGGSDATRELRAALRPGGDDGPP
jgi:hypothetical protein